MGLKFEVDRCGEGCLLHYHPSWTTGGLSGLHRSCSGQAIYHQRPPAASPLEGLAQGQLGSHTVCWSHAVRPLLQYKPQWCILKSAVLNRYPADVKYLQNKLNLHGGVVQVAESTACEYLPANISLTQVRYLQYKLNLHSGVVQVRNHCL